MASCHCSASFLRISNGGGSLDDGNSFDRSSGCCSPTYHCLEAALHRRSISFLCTSGNGGLFDGTGLVDMLVCCCSLDLYHWVEAAIHHLSVSFLLTSNGGGSLGSNDWLVTLIGCVDFQGSALNSFAEGFKMLTGCCLRFSFSR